MFNRRRYGVFVQIAGIMIGALMPESQNQKRTATSAPCAIHAEDIHKSYRHGSTLTPVLRGVTLDVAEEECVVLAGPSGSGKTTLLSILGSILLPDHGQVKILGEDLNDLHPDEKTQFRCERLGLVLQRCQLMRGLTTLENVCVPLDLCGVARRAARNRGMELLEAVGLADKRAAHPAQLSAGQSTGRAGPGAG
jgi:putative ABC transport system ATP-binding protein